MRVTDVFLALPQLILALALAQLMAPSLESAMMALALTYWPFFARLVHAETRRLRTALFVDALRGIGAGDARILLLHILPNVAVADHRARDDRHGLHDPGRGGARASSAWARRRRDPDWGLAIAESRNYLPGAWWFAIFPGLAILLTVLGFNLLGDGLRDLVDPRLRRSR